jgi:Mrp family chromosome partitioning ATPase
MSDIKADELFLPVSSYVKKGVQIIGGLAGTVLVASILVPFITYLFEYRMDPTGRHPWPSFSEYIFHTIKQPVFSWTVGISLGCLLTYVVISFLIENDRINATKLMRPAQTLAEIQIRFPRSPVTAIPSSRQLEAPEDAFDWPFTKEALHSLRTVLRRVGKEPPPRKVLVTSSQPGEGKTTIAIGLARSLASSGERVLLVDADLRMCRLSRTLGHKDSTGLSDFDPRNSHDSVVRAFDPNGLNLLPAGKHSDDAATLLDRLSRDGAWNRLAADSDWVIIDGPPVLGLADAPTLARDSETIVFVIEAHRTRLSSVVGAINRLAVDQETIVLALSKTTKMWADFSFGLAPGYFAEYGFNYAYGYGLDPLDEAERRRITFEGLQIKWGAPIPLSHLSWRIIGWRSLMKLYESKLLIIAVAVASIQVSITAFLLMAEPGIFYSVFIGMLCFAVGIASLWFAHGVDFHRYNVMASLDNVEDSALDDQKLSVSEVVAKQSP